VRVQGGMELRVLHMAAHGTTWYGRALGLTLTLRCRGGCAQGGMELRVLHMAAHGTTWYGRWGYAFGRGGFIIQAPAWRAAAAAVAAAPLAALRADFTATGADADALRVLERYEVRCGGSERLKPLQGCRRGASLWGWRCRAGCLGSSAAYGAGRCLSACQTCH